jgi:hypothetical protein
MPIRVPPRRPRSAARLGVLVPTAALGLACGDPASPTPPAATFGFTPPPAVSATLAGRGEIVAATAGPRVPRSAAALALAGAGAGGTFTARYDVQPWTVRYRTPGVDGALTTASGAVYLPVGAGGALPVLTYLHGTVTARTDVPSNLASGEGQLFGTAYATDGFAAVLPDYLGLGSSDAPFHPYLHVATQASAAVDLLRAARTLAAQQGAALDANALFLTGYSQGGGAAQGLHRVLERDHAAEFPVRASAPMSGPYDLSATARRLITGNPAYRPSVVYATYLAGSMTRTYQLRPQLADVLAPPADAAADALLAGTAAAAQLALLPARPRAVLQPGVVAAIEADDAHPFWRALRDNDVLDWAPRAPVRLYFGGADRDVPPDNATTAAARMRAAGAANVAAVNVGAGLDHGGAVLPATLAGKRFVDSVRAGLVR